MVIDATVRLNDGADWVGVKGEKNWTKDRALGDPMLKGNRIESVLPTLTECVLPDRYDLNQLSASSLIP